jgi:hypothetical protein
VRLELRYPATAENAGEHALLAVELLRQECDDELDFSSHSLEAVDAQIERWRADGLGAEEAAEALFVLGCYLGEVFVRGLLGRWQRTAQSPLAPLSPWPMVVVLRDGSAWDVIGKVFTRFEVGDSEYLPAYFAAAAVRFPRGRMGSLS